jgi:hypothetical protein
LPGRPAFVGALLQVAEDVLDLFEAALRRSMLPRGLEVGPIVRSASRSRNIAA